MLASKLIEEVNGQEDSLALKKIDIESKLSITFFSELIEKVNTKGFQDQY